ncbi:MAG: MoaD/ThiS family protein, partial [Deferribacteraceae bacterium]|nr:MoaD/ThiS family protein [Deferribacteraceae bacterium]
NFTERKSAIILDASTVGEALALLVERYPDVRTHIYEESGLLRSYINIYLGENNINSLGGLDLKVNNGDSIMIVPAIAGGKA